MPPRKGQSEAAAERRVWSLDLRKKGYSYREIGRELGISEAQAHRDVHRMLDHLCEIERDTAEKIRRMEIMRLDSMLRGLWTSVEDGDPQAVTASLKVSERRAKLLGLDAPSRQELTGRDGGPLATANVDLTKLSDEDLATLAQILDRAGSAGS